MADVLSALSDAFIDQVGKAYEARIGYKADFYVVEVGDGPGEI